ncbi:lytic transglycosylase domain-containing protein [Microbacterium lushaniae]|uniref:aggregation-promoting factor C-terminal-like domain-containing protein n=1 Tax=Microbacterium lushaniae TaxID=2614639 RepID=UPI001EE7AC35|nr:lytic transglycosylase domain-containing protein [Microbacterium lushaniae]
MTSGTEMTRATSGPIVRRPGNGIDVVPPPTPPRRAPRWSRRRGVLAVFAGLSALGFVAAYVGPTGAALAEVDPDRVSLFESALADTQSYPLTTGDIVPATLERGAYSVYVTPKPTPTPTPRSVAASAGASSSSGWQPPFVAPDPGTAQAIAYEMVLARGWGDDQFACLRALWQKESGWRVNAYNSSSGAYGIPQALPGSKMASAGADWETNPATQIAWGLGYIGGRYGDPCGAWASSQSRGWY